MTLNWTGKDPRLRFLRSIAFLVILALLVFVVVIPETQDLSTLGTLAGLLLVFGGFEAGLHWPGQQRVPPEPPPLAPPPILDPPIPTPEPSGGGEWDTP